MKTNNVSKLDMYHKALADYNDSKEIIKELKERAKLYGTITISGWNINSISSDSQFIFALGLLISQIAACTELGLDPTDFINTKNSVKELHAISKELDVWCEYSTDIQFYLDRLDDLLTEDEKFQLMEYPVKP